MKRNLISAFEQVAARNLLPGAIHLLVDDGLALADFAAGGLEDEVAPGIHLEAVGSLKGDPDHPGISPGGEDEVVFEPSLAAVVHEAHAGINIPVLNLRIGGNARAPGLGVVADEVVGRAGQLL